MGIRTGILPSDTHYVYVNKIVDEADLSLSWILTTTMSKRLQTNEPFLHLLARSSTKRRKFLLKQATKEELASLFEICLNILRGNSSLSPHMHKQLKRERNTLRKLAGKTISLKQRKKVINQKGGFFGTIASIALPLLAQILSK